jgi:hypothetical protein
VLVNNRSEGNAPQTVQALADMLRQYKSTALSLSAKTLMPARQLMTGF